jgi:uncharacterized membrane protein YhaH (DUF805 family)
MEWYLQALRRYTDFSGRSRRKEYWMFALFTVIFSVTTTILDYILGTDSFILNTGFLSFIYGLGIFIPTISVSVRRLHDTGKSGWMLLVAIIPLIGAIWLLVLFLTDSAPGENQYGSNPKENV